MKLSFKSTEIQPPSPISSIPEADEVLAKNKKEGVHQFPTLTPYKKLVSVKGYDPGMMNSGLPVLPSKAKMTIFHIRALWKKWDNSFNFFHT